MATESIRAEALIFAPPARIYAAWLDSEQHSKMTGGKATIEPQVGGKHSAHDGYIWGTILELVPGERIVLAWRTPEFKAEDHDSRVEIVFAPAEGGTRLSLEHGNIPEGQGARYEEGWHLYYFEPMTEFFAGAGTPSVHPAAGEQDDVAPHPAPLAKAAPRKAARAKKAAAPAKKAAPKKAAPKKAAPKKAKQAAKKATAPKAKPKKAAQQKKKKKAAASKKKTAPKKAASKK